MRTLRKLLWSAALLGLPVMAAPIYMTGGGSIAFLEGPWGTDLSASGSSVDGDTVSIFVSIATYGGPLIPGGTVGNNGLNNASVSLSSGQTYRSNYFSYLFGDNGYLTLRNAPSGQFPPLPPGDPIITVPISGYIRINPPSFPLPDYLGSFTIVPTPEPATFFGSGLVIGALLLRARLARNRTRVCQRH